MAPVLSRSLASASLASLPPSFFTLKHSKQALNLRSTFIPYNRLRHGLFGGGLKWKIERKQNRTFVRCDTAVADKEAADASGEKFEYQAEVGFCIISDFFFSPINSIAVQVVRKREIIKVKTLFLQLFLLVVI